MVKKTKDIQYYEAVGRRKESVARVRLYLTTREKTVNIDNIKAKPGEMYINSKLLDSAYSSIAERKRIMLPLILTNNEERFAILIKVRGGGKNGQLDAISHGISRAIEKTDKEAYRKTLKEKGLLKRDARTRERRKVGTGGKARRQKQSPKR